MTLASQEVGRFVIVYCISSMLYKTSLTLKKCLLEKGIWGRAKRRHLVRRDVSEVTQA